jgi:hypothetical protein
MLKSPFGALLLLLLCGRAIVGQPAPTIPAVGTYAQVCGNSNPLGTQACNFPGKRTPLVTDDTTKGYVGGNHWTLPSQSQDWVATNNTSSGTLPAGNALWGNSFPGSARALDVAAAGGYQAQGWWGTQLATKNANVVANNKALDIWRNSDGTTYTAGWLAGGDIDAASIDTFCAPATSCEVSKAYDQAYNISTLAMLHNDSTQTPGFILLGSTLVAGGTCAPDGTYVFTAAGGAAGSVSATVSGTVTGGTVVGSLTVTNGGSYTQYNGTFPAPLTVQSGGTCSVAPTVSQSWTHYAPIWTTNVINGHRAITITDWYGGGNQYGVGGSQGSSAGQLIGTEEWLAWPSGVSTHVGAASLIWSAQLRTSIYHDNIIATLGAPVSGYRFAASAIRDGSSCATSTNIPSPTFFCDQNTTTPLPPLSSPAVWTFVTGNPTTKVTIGNLVGTIPSSNLPVGGSSATGGNTGPGAIGGGLSGFWDMLSQGVFDVQISDGVKSNIIAAQNIQGGMIPQAPIDLIVIADSQMMGWLSTTGESSPKDLTQFGILNAPVNVINLSYPGGQYLTGAYSYTANFTNNWLPLCNSARDQYVFLNLGVNDIGTLSTDAVTYTRAQNYASLIATNCPTAKMIQGTLPYKVVANSWTSQMAAYLASYNATVAACGATPRTQITTACPAGGLGAIAVIDLYNDPLFSQGQNTVINYAIQQSGHLNVQGLTEEGWTMGRGFNQLLK